MTQTARAYRGMVTAPHHLAAQADTSDREIQLATVPIQAWIPRSDVSACAGMTSKSVFCLS